MLFRSYNPVTGKYGLAVMNALRVAGGLTVAALVAFMIRALRRDRRSATAGVVL